MYEIELSKQARKTYLKLPETMRTMIYKKLHGIPHCYRLRVKDWRVLYRIYNATFLIEVIKIGHRKEVYQ